MSLPNLIVALLLAVWAWRLRARERRLRRVEYRSGAWRVQGPPWAAPAWYATDEFDRALARWDRELHDERPIDENGAAA